MKTYKGATLDSVIVLENGKRVMASEYFDEEDEDFDYQINEKVSIGWVKGWEVILHNESR
jgi:spermidine/putrescine transport system ATP-binding protein